jgi:hypothetical protein
MGITNFPQGVSSFGVPVLGGGSYIMTGKFWFVHHSGGGKGTKTSPFATIDAAIGNCTANQGDTVLVMPGHSESITAATSLVMDVAGVSVIGLGQGRTRPVLTFDNTAGSIEMDAANCRISNMIWQADVSAVVVACNVDADYCEIDHIETTYNATGDDFAIILDIDNVNYTHVHDCVFNTEHTAGAVKAIRIDEADFTTIEMCKFNGNWSGAVILAEGALSPNVTMNNLVIFNSDTSVYNGIDMGSLSTTGTLSNSVITALYATAVAKIFRDGDLCYHNLSLANAVSEYGAKIVGTSSA